MMELDLGRILVIEDDKTWQEIYKDWLGPHGEGYILDMAANKNEAITALSQQEYSLVIIDLSVPRSEADTDPKLEHGEAIIDFILGMECKPKVLSNTGMDMLPLSVSNKLKKLTGSDQDIQAKKSNGLSELKPALHQLVGGRATHMVMKFGGTSMGTTASISSVAKAIIDYVQTQTAPCTVVVSAMSKVTDQLLAAAALAQAGNLNAVEEIVAQIQSRHLEVAEKLILDDGLCHVFVMYLNEMIGNLMRLYRGTAALEEMSLRTQDRIVGFGEQLSAHLLAQILKSRNMASTFVDATDLIITDGVHGAATPLWPETTNRTRNKLLPLLEQGTIPIVTGFIAKSIDDGSLTTLGRGGSDYTATILGNVLNARAIWIWTDVDGVMNADPNLVPQAVILEEISYEQAATLTSYGAKVLYAKALLPVTQKEIFVRIRNTFAPEKPGTLIGPSARILHEAPSLVTHTKLALIAVSNGLNENWKSAVAIRTLTVLEHADIELLSYTRSFSQRKLSLVFRRSDAERATKLLEREFREEAITVTLDQDQVAAVSLIGGKQVSPSSLEEALATLNRDGVNLIGILQSPGENTVSFLIDESYLMKTIGALSQVNAFKRRWQ